MKKRPVRPPPTRKKAVCIEHPEDLLELIPMGAKFQVPRRGSRLKGRSPVEVGGAGVSGAMAKEVVDLIEGLAARHRRDRQVVAGRLAELKRSRARAQKQLGALRQELRCAEQAIRKETAVLEAVDREEVDITGVKALARGLAAQGALRPGSEALEWIESKPDRVPWDKWKDWYPMFLRMIRAETRSR